MRLLFAACLVSGLALTACGGAEDQAGTAAPTGDAPSSASPTPSTGPTTAEGAKPTDEQSLAFLMALGRVDPRLGGDPDVSLAAAQEVCQDIRAGSSDDEVAERAADRFSTGGVTVDAERGAAIADAVRTAFCG